MCNSAPFVLSPQILNLPIIGSEIVGLVSLQIMLSAADYYIQKENLFIVHEHQKIRLAVDRLGLNQLDTFDPNEKIIEYKMSLRKDGRFVGSSVRQFVEQVSTRSSTPGGGSVSACIAAMVTCYICACSCVSYALQCILWTFERLLKCCSVCNKIIYFSSGSCSGYNGRVDDIWL